MGRAQRAFVLLFLPQSDGTIGFMGRNSRSVNVLTG